MTTSACVHNTAQTVLYFCAPSCISFSRLCLWELGIPLDVLQYWSTCKQKILFKFDSNNGGLNMQKVHSLSLWHCTSNINSPTFYCNSVHYCSVYESRKHYLIQRTNLKIGNIEVVKLLLAQQLHQHIPQLKLLLKHRDFFAVFGKLMVPLYSCCYYPARACAAVISRGWCLSVQWCL